MDIQNRVNKLCYTLTLLYAIVQINDKNLHVLFSKDISNVLLCQKASHITVHRIQSIWITKKDTHTHTHRYMQRTFLNSIQQVWFYFIFLFYYFFLYYAKACLTVLHSTPSALFVQERMSLSCLIALSKRKSAPLLHGQRNKAARDVCVCRCVCVYLCVCVYVCV